MMRSRYNKWGLLMMGALLCPTILNAQVRVSPLPEKSGIELMTDYEVTVTSDVTGETFSVPTLRADVDLKKVQKASLALMEMEGGATVRVRMTADTVSTFMVRPQSKGISARKIDSRSIEFHMSKPEYLSVEFNGDRKHNLHLLCDSLLRETYSGDEPRAINWTGQSAQDVFVKDASLIYFGPGVHQAKDLPAADIRIPSNCTVYLAPGSVVKARLVVDHAENVRIVGRGIISHPLRGVEVTHSKNVLIDGVTVLNPQHYTVFGGQSSGITIRHLKSFSCKPWSDGIDLMSCRKVLIEDIFLRTSDDCLAFYNHRWWYWGDSEDFRVRRATLWADVAHPVNIATHGDDRSDRGETLSRVDIADCDILNSCADAVLKVAAGDKNWVRDIAISDIRIEDIEKGTLFSLSVIFSGKYNRAPGNEIRGVRFANISYIGTVDMADGVGTGLATPIIKDFDESRCVRDLRFDNISIGGKKVGIDGRP